MEPSVAVYHFLRGFLVLVVAKHHVCASCDQLAGLVGRVRTVNLHLHVLHGRSA